jgi:hypothetical protein
VQISNLGQINQIGLEMVRTIQIELSRVQDSIDILKNTLGVYERQFTIVSTVTSAPVESTNSQAILSRVTNQMDIDHMIPDSNL